MKLSRYLPPHTSPRIGRRTEILSYVHRMGLLVPLVPSTVDTPDKDAVYLLQTPVNPSPPMLMVFWGKTVSLVLSREYCCELATSVKQQQHRQYSPPIIVRVRYVEGNTLAYPEAVLIWKGTDVREIDTQHSFNLLNTEALPFIHQAIVYNPVDDIKSLLAIPRCLFFCGKTPAESVCIQQHVPESATNTNVKSETHYRKNKERVEQTFLMKPHPNKLPDVYFLHPWEHKTTTYELALILDRHTSEECALWVQEQNGVVLVRAYLHHQWKRWVPFKKLDTSSESFPPLDVLV